MFIFLCNLESKFFDNSKIKDPGDSCRHELEQVYCEMALRMQKHWTCDTVPKSKQYLGNERIYFQDLSFFKDQIPVPLDSYERLYLDYVHSLNFLGMIIFKFSKKYSYIV